MEIWDNNESRLIDMPEAMENFLKDIEKVCKKHNLSISHEAGHGAFQIEEYSEDMMERLFAADKCYKEIRSCQNCKTNPVCTALCIEQKLCPNWKEIEHPEKLETERK